MRFQTTAGGRRGVLAIAALVASLAAGPHAFAQDAAPEAPAAKEPEAAPKPKKRHVVRKPPAKSAEVKSAAVTPGAAPAPAAAPAAPATAPAAATAGTSTPEAAKPTQAIDFAAQLDKAGASACHGQVNALATSTMGSVVKFNTMSNWSPEDGGKRAVSVAIGQKYADGSAVPFSVSQVISAPNQRGSCDGFTVQIFPSPLPCGKLRESLATRGQQIGDLAGIPLMQDAAGRTMLVPTAANTCVLVATRTVYAK